MYRFLETIRIDNGRLTNLPLHQERVNRAMATFYSDAAGHDLGSILSDQRLPAAGVHKCRMVYDVGIRRIEITPYRPAPIGTVKLVVDDEILYEHKFEDRSSIERLIGMKGDCDDVLVVRKGLITDTSIGNVAFKRGNLWITPSSCLLKGTMREHLLQTRMIHEEEVRPGDLHRFSAFKMINAMLKFESPELDINNIVRG